MKKFRTSFLIIAIILALLIPKFFCTSKQGQAGAGSKGPGGAKQPVKVSSYTVTNQKLNPEYLVSGTILANEQVTLKPEAQGLVSKILFTEGSRVAKGQLLVKLNDTEFQAQLKKAMANQKLKEENARRNEVLLKKEAISQAEYDLSITDLNAGKADIDYLKEQIRKTELRAPFSGKIGLRSISEGAYVTAATTIASLQDVSKMKIEFSIPEKYYSAVKEGMEITFKVDGSDKTFKAKIYAREPLVSDLTRSVVMRAICENPDGILIPGQFANIVVKMDAGSGTFMIPTQALVPVLKGQKVFLIKGDSASEMMVKTGYRSNDKIEITEGLKPGDQVIVEGVMYIKNGSKVISGRK